MNMVVNLEFIFDLLKLALYIGCAYTALRVCACRFKTSWLLRLTARRFTVLALITLFVLAIKLFEDVMAKESGPVDTALMWLIRRMIPPAWGSFFELITLTGSARFLAPATVILSAFFLLTRHRQQAVLLTTTMVCGWVLTYTVKALVNRPRPELWSTAWYWGASFPSGHTLNTAAFATALVIGTAQIWPEARYLSLPAALIWILLMGLSRMVLGVHWPTDVLAAVCLGVFIPLAISLLVFKDDKDNVSRTTPHSAKLDTLVD